MVPKAFWFRLNSAVLAVWLALVGVAPSLVHHCAVHSPGANLDRGSAIVAGESGSAHGLEMPMASGPMAHGSHGAPGSTHGSKHDRSCCTCLGCCCLAPPAVARTTSAQFVAALTAFTSEFPTLHEHLVTQLDFILPFATAPPSHMT